MSSENNWACAIAEAIGIGWEEVRGLSNHQLTPVEVVFPSERDVSYYANSRIRIAAKDRADWDVILHEFGHYVAEEFGFGGRKGGEHRYNENLGHKKGKADALALAWTEGWASYFAVTSLLRIAEQDIPDVGDTRFQDRVNVSVDIDLSRQDRFKSLGEDNEVAVMRVLFDLHDELKIPDDRVSLGPKRIWDAMTVAKPSRLGELLDFLLRGAVTADSVAYGAILSTHRISPVATEPSELAATRSPPTFRWAAGTAPYIGTRFLVSIYDAEWRLLHSSGPLDEASYTPLGCDWKRIVSSVRWPLVWVVQAFHPARPETGPYFSQPMRLRLP